MNSTSTIQSVSSSSSVASSGSSAPLTSLIVTVSSSFAAAGSTSIEPIISTASVPAASSAESATDNLSLSSVIIQSDRQASPSVSVSPMSSGQERQADMSSTTASTSVTARTTQATTTSAPVAAPPDTGDGTSSTSTISSSSSSEVVVTTSSSSTTVQAPPTTNTVTSTQPGTTVTTTNPGTTNDAPTTSVTASASSEERPLESAAAATATATVTQQTGAPVSGSSIVSNGDNSGGTSRATGIVASSVNPAASTVSTVHSTLPQAIGVTVTGPNGQTSVTFPSLVTVLSTATESDGSVVTESAVVSNPTGLGQPDKNSDSSFFSNTSAVAGTFAAVGIVVFAVLALLLVCYRRRRRQTARTRWLTAISGPPSYPLHDDADRDPFEEDDPFEDPRNVPQMAQMTNTPQTTYLNRDLRHEGSEHVDTEESTTHLLGTRNYAAETLGTGSTLRPQTDEGPFSDANMFSPQEAIGLAITTNYAVPSLHSRQSTPSLYSDSPQVHDDADSFYDVHPGSPPPVPRKTETEARPAAPPALPRPPRSILRGAPPSRGSDYRPLTPPDSVESQRFSIASSSAGPATPTGFGFATGSSFDHETAKLATPLAPTLSPTAILTRRTLLDIRPRPSRDNVLMNGSGRV